MNTSEGLGPDKLLCTMKISERITHSHLAATRLVQDMNIINRSFAVEWMKKVC